jgi:hypothetical protein
MHTHISNPIASWETETRKETQGKTTKLRTNQLAAGIKVQETTVDH